MDDIAGIGKVADSKLANKLYDDAVSAAARELGDAAGDVIKTLRLFTAPFQMAAVAQDRFKLWLDEARRRVPIERQVPALPSIAGPALRAMLFLEEEDPLAEMFVNLLSKAIDKNTKLRVHPGFVKALEHLSPDEAVLLTKFNKTLFLGVQIHYIAEENRVKSLTTFPKMGLGEPDSIYMYLEHLESLGLCRVMENMKAHAPDHPNLEAYTYYRLTSFGSSFLEICEQGNTSAGGDTSRTDSKAAEKSIVEFDQ